MRKIIIPVFCVTISVSVLSEPISKEQIEEAKMQMIYRISLSAEEYGKENHIAPEIISHCKSKLFEHTDGNTGENQAPFSIDKDIETSEQLEKVLSIRESYERSILKICLKTTKK